MSPDPLDLLTRGYDLVAARPASLLAAVLALAVVAWRPTWRLTRTAVTIAHEGGHALVAVLVGRGLTGIRLHADSSGVTYSTGAGRGPGVVVMFLAGYVFPPLLGLGGAVLVASDAAQAMLWIGVALLAATLLQIRNLYGGLAVVVTGAVLVLVALRAEEDLRTGFAAALAWFLLFGGVKACTELRRGRRGGRLRHSDADRLAELTPLSGGAWAGFFLIAAVVATGAAGWVVFAPGGAPA
ncbi:putative integral membrane protein [Pseudonocardia sp. Ae168_Ps1]|uniref:M50 family metallopeptidase n=1 Tax=unclassified Pseudonocardia TaxID=2619320 RepID=UPI0001FFE682|nr:MULTISPECIES: M50 family metallopeptidase [unclassified Pseudonocardia]OLL71274.1 putative integral membrane protein [Pseudonocardia sp. Ae168_Ps1]OLL77174.1 putative integral membrane protein [Pseudonocardia sp. Ae150A_Ps1]OLL88718.1 putative integral membrane protein [Pseudonocardia sp. Ae263_Ps1]OLL91262.1 putative integral membrane protein [Pseudonocardia sp. Ae356_Ps1]